MEVGTGVNRGNPSNEFKPILIFVYNANSGFINSFKDLIHKKIKPSTYSCRLCAITFGNFSMKDDWKNFIFNELGLPVEFLHRNEFKKQHDVENVSFPAAFIKTGSKIKLVITSNEINKCRTMDDLINLVKEKTAGLD